ncbi:Type II transport protein GspH [Alteromonadaceae bacterium Bs31]|nr:Type II transport protein GspH [Alteromonadaceae bacterium Bs31]
MWLTERMAGMNKGETEFSWRQQNGFTLLELFITLFLASILLAFAIPSFNNTLERNTTRSTMADFITAMAYARSEAVRRGEDFSVLTISGSASWSEGWCVISKEQADKLSSGQSCRGAASVVRVFEGYGNLHVTGISSTSRYDFNEKGHLDSASQEIHICGKKDIGRKVLVTTLGQALAQECNCGEDTHKCT